MDSLTQAVLGAAIGEAGYRHRLGGRAVVFGAICGTLPDLDVIVGGVDPWLYLLHHRGVTHSLLTLPVAAVPIGALAAKLSGVGRPRDWIACAFWALITHPLLDVFTAYGTQLLAPLSDHRFAIDGVSIIDPVYTLPLVAATALAATRWRRLSRAVAAGALAWGLLWLGLGLGLGARAKAEGLARLQAEGVEVRRLRAMPGFGTHLVHRVVAERADGGLSITQTSALVDGDGPVLHLEPARGADVELARAHPHVQLFSWFADGYLHTGHLADSTGADVTFDDLRYGRLLDPAAPLWRARARVEGGAVVGVTREDAVRGGLGPELDAQWRLLWTGRVRP